MAGPARMIRQPGLTGLGQTTEAAQRLTAENSARQARAEYSARLEREAHAESEHIMHAQASYEAEIEL